MVLKGTFDTIPLPEIFQLLAGQKKTGLLTVTDGTRNAKIQFIDGNIISASEERTDTEGRIGKMMVKSGLISGMDLQDALAVKKNTDKKLGQILIELRMIDENMLKDILRLQNVHLIYQLFRLGKGKYHFDPEAEVSVDIYGMDPISADFILLEGARITDEWVKISKKIHSPNLMFKIVKPYTNDEKTKLTDEEKRVYLQINDQNTVQEIGYCTRLAEFDVRKALYKFLRGGIIEEDSEAARKIVFNVDFVNPFLEATKTTIETMTGIEVTAGKPRTKKRTELAFGDISSVIILTGQKDGQLAITFTKRCVIKVISSMLGIEIKYIDINVRDAVGEIINIIAGVGRQKLAKQNYVFSASIPTTIVGERHFVDHASAPVHPYPILHEVRQVLRGNQPWKGLKKAASAATGGSLVFYYVFLKYIGE